jgi:hypothetical protein
MITTDMFTYFGRRMAATQGCPYIVIADTPNPIRQLDGKGLRERAEAMLPVIVDGLILPREEIVRRIKDLANEQIRPKGVVRSQVPI